MVPRVPTVGVGSVPRVALFDLDGRLNVRGGVVVAVGSVLDGLVQRVDSALEHPGRAAAGVLAEILSWPEHSHLPRSQPPSASNTFEVCSAS